MAAKFKVTFADFGSTFVTNLNGYAVTYSILITNVFFLLVLQKGRAATAGGQQMN